MVKVKHCNRFFIRTTEQVYLEGITRPCKPLQALAIQLRGFHFLNIIGNHQYSRTHLNFKTYCSSEIRLKLDCIICKYDWTWLGWNGWVRWYGPYFACKGVLFFPGNDLVRVDLRSVCLLRNSSSIIFRSPFYLLCETSPGKSYWDSVFSRTMTAGEAVLQWSGRRIQMDYIFH